MRYQSPKREQFLTDLRRHWQQLQSLLHRHTQIQHIHTQKRRDYYSLNSKESVIY